MRIFNDGAEMRDTLFWDGWNNEAPTVQSATPFVSPYYYQINTGGSRRAFHNLPAAISEGYARIRVRVNVAPSSGFLFLAFMLSTTYVAYIGLDNTNHWTANVTTVGLVGTSVSSLIINTWYELEVYFKEANAPNGRFVLKVDGNIVIDYTGDTQPAATSTFDNLLCQAADGSNLMIDDFAFNDTSNADGLNDNSWCGDGSYVRVIPNGNGTTNDWTGVDGDQVNNYLQVLEFPKDDDVTYVYHNGAISGHQDQYALSHLSFTGYTITRIYAETRARKTAAAAHTIKVGTLAAGGADVVSAAQNLFVGAYSRVVGPDQKVNPVDTNPWEEADIDALEAVIETG